MARPLRIQRAGAWYYVSCHGNNRNPIFLSDADRTHFLELLSQMPVLFRLRLHGYVLLDNHYHLLLELGEPNLSRAVQWLNISHGVWFNRRHQRQGHLFQGRFKALLLDPATWAVPLSQFLHLNPVRSLPNPNPGPDAPQALSAVSERLKTLRLFPWSSYAAYAGKKNAPPWLNIQTVLDLGGWNKGEAKKEYRHQVEQTLRQGVMPSPWQAVRHRIVLGSEEFVRQLKVTAGVKGNRREPKEVRALTQRPGMETIIQVVEKVRGDGLKWASFRDLHGDLGRDMVLYLGRRHSGLSVGDLGKAVGMKEYMTVTMAIARFRKKLATERRLRSMIAQAESQLYKS